MDDCDELRAQLIRHLETYFPGVRGVDGIYILFAADLLEAAGEPVLADLQPADRVYRLTAHPRRSAPLVVRAQLGERGGELHGCVFAGGGGGRALGPVETRSSRRVAEAEARATVALIDELDLFALPRMGREAGMDGGSWFLECRHAGAYHPLYRWSPDRFSDARFLRAGNHLLALAGLGGLVGTR